MDGIDFGSVEPLTFNHKTHTIGHTMTNKEIIEAFINGQRTSNLKNLRSDGSFLYSYDLKIASVFNKNVIITDYTKPNFKSQTTSRHVGMIKSACALKGINHTIVEPK